ncbi:MAG: IS66 family insertion sequence element accessory protein TnpB [Planctomycetaceae bacterium]|nr:IS66 family insertion sequence element accessory protein TnpB [Planctomycetaceae bacterium]
MPVKPRRPRDPAKEKHWRGIIQRHQRSGLSVHAFCEREGLKDGNFLWWRRELNRRDREKTTAHPISSDKESPQPSASPVFLPVRVVDAGVEAARQTTPIEILLPYGPTVRVPVGFDPWTLGEILAVLEGRRC